MTDREDKIRQRAYNIWEQEGYPHGHADDHWHRAAREVEGSVAAEPELPHLGSAPSLQPADMPPAKKPVVKRRKPVSESAPAAAPKTKVRTRAAATRNGPTKKG